MFFAGRMLQWFLPKELCFFTFFNTHAALIHQAAQELCGERDPVTIKELEHAADRITHQCKESLHKIFITPIDRDDIFELISTMDDIIDRIDTVANRYSLYKIHTATPYFDAQVKLLCQAAQHLEQAIKALPQLEDPHPIMKHCVEINSIENKADRLLNTALADLFDAGNKDPYVVFKWKEIYELVEEAIDRCEDVANIVEGIILEYT